MVIEEVAHDRTFTTMCISGLSVAEVNEILDGRADALCDVLERHGEGSLATCWKCGYGIYSIRHCGENVFVQIGNSCD